MVEKKEFDLIFKIQQMNSDYVLIRKTDLNKLLDMIGDSHSFKVERWEEKLKEKGE